ncbi:MAG: hypothetical protein K0S40_3941, partial [Actinomycetospora sp.]|nr:hypothetical protein [Actinomycetospora sp.]
AGDKPSSVAPNYGAPPGWTPATVPHGTTWNPGGAGRSGGPSASGGQHGGPYGGHHGAPQGGPASGPYGTSRSPGESVPNPYGDPDGRTREGRHTGSPGWGRDGQSGQDGHDGPDGGPEGRDTPRGQG